MNNSSAFILGQIPGQTVGAIADNHNIQLISLIAGVVIQLTTLFINKRRANPKKK